MTRSRLLFGWPILVSILWLATASAQKPERQPGADLRPMIFGDGIRAREPLAQSPQYAVLVPGLYTRQILQAPSAKGDYTVAIWALLVAPKASTADAKLPGATVLSLTAGSVELVMGERKIRLEAGATAAVPEGAALRFINSDESRPAHLRAVVLTGSR